MYNRGNVRHGGGSRVRCRRVSASLSLPWSGVGLRGWQEKLHASVEGEMRGGEWITGCFFLFSLFLRKGGRKVFSPFSQRLVGSTMGELSSVFLAHVKLFFGNVRMVGRSCISRVFFSDAWAVDLPSKWVCSPFPGEFSFSFVVVPRVRRRLWCWEAFVGPRGPWLSLGSSILLGFSLATSVEAVWDLPVRSFNCSGSFSFSFRGTCEKKDKGSTREKRESFVARLSGKLTWGGA